MLFSDGIGRFAMQHYPKSVRLRHSQEFRQTLDRGLKVVGPLLVVFARERPAVATGRAVAVPAVVARSAVESACA